MLICESCGEIFDESALKTDYEPHGEPIGVCPMCGSSFLKEAKFCRECHEQYDEDDLTCGWCDDCLEEHVTVDSFLAFAVDGYEEDEISIFDEFMFQSWLGLEYGDIPDCSSRNMKQMFRREYEYIKKTDSAFLDAAVKLFVMNEYKTEFAEWLEAEEARLQLMKLGKGW